MPEDITEIKQSRTLHIIKTGRDLSTLTFYDVINAFPEINPKIIAVVDESQNPEKPVKILKRNEQHHYPFGKDSCALETFVFAYAPYNFDQQHRDGVVVTNTLIERDDDLLKKCFKVDEVNYLIL
ncbi:MAG: hypothetical protein V1663_05390 [archaeon]